MLGKGTEEGPAPLTLNVNLIPPCLGLCTHTFRPTEWSEISFPGLNAPLWVPIPHTVKTPRLHPQDLLPPYLT